MLLKQLFKFLLVLILLYNCGNAKAQLSDWEYGGYIKNLATYLDGTFAGLPNDMGKFQNIFQGRLNIDLYPVDAFTFSAQSRHLLNYQENIKKGSNFFKQLSRSSYYFDLTWEVFDKNDANLFSELDRLNLLWSYGDLEIKLGRQRIAWGTCLVWNPTDLFNASNILDFDYPEKPGSDAIRVQYYLDALSSVEIAVSPGRTKEDVIYAARYLTNFWNYDFSILAGWQKETLRLGGSWAGEIFDGGFWGEVIYSNPDIDTNLPIDATVASTLPPGFLPRMIVDNPYWTFVLSYDYTFANSFYIHTEWLYNELGMTKNSGIRRMETLITGELSPSRHSIFQEFAYNITPLIRGDIFFIFNPTDKSWIAAPSLNWSVATNWELYFLAFPSKGKTGSEFGGFPPQYFLRAQFSF